MSKRDYKIDYSVLKPYFDQDITVFAETNFRQQRKKFGIRDQDRKKHMYIIGKAGMGKTSMLHNMLVQDIEAGKGVCVVALETGLIDQLLHYIPESRIKDVIYFDPTDIDYPLGFNLLQTANNDLARQHLTSSLVSIFKNLWSDIWTPRIEYILEMCLLTLMQNENNSFLHLLPLLRDAGFRDNLLEQITDPGLRSFWENEFELDSERFNLAVIKPLQSKISRIVSNSMLRNILGQHQTLVNFDDIIANNKIVLLNLNQNKIGDQAVKILGFNFIFRLFTAAKQLNQKKDQLEQDFTLYVDELQNFTPPFLPKMLTSTNFGFNLILANQYFDQLPPEIAQAILVKVGTLVCFRTAVADAKRLALEFGEMVNVSDLTELPQHHIILRLLINGEVSTPFSGITLDPLPVIGLADKIIQYSRVHYAHRLQEIETEIAKDLNLEKATASSARSSLEKDDIQQKAEQFRQELANLNLGVQKDRRNQQNSIVQKSKESFLNKKTKPKKKPSKSLKNLKSLKPGERVRLE